MIVGDKGKGKTVLQVEQLKVKVGAFVLMASASAVSHFLFSNDARHPLDPKNLSACRKCLDRKERNIRCPRFVQCLIGDDPTANYIKETMPIFRQMALEMFGKNI